LVAEIDADREPDPGGGARCKQPMRPRGLAKLAGIAEGRGFGRHARRIGVSGAARKCHSARGSARGTSAIMPGMIGRMTKELVGRIVLPDRVVAGRLRLREGLIEAILPDATAAAGPYLVPGFIDLHVHGWGGHSAMDGPDALT